MTFEQAMAALEAAGTESHRKTFLRHGVREPLFGVSYAAMGALKKAIKVDHDLAIALWASGNHDARILATMVADPARADRALLESWARDLSCYVLTDAFAKVVAPSPHARALMADWLEADGEWISRTGWLVLAQLVLGPEFPEEEARPYIARIERDIHAAKNRTRDAMNSALIAIGMRSDELEREAIAAARRIGKVEVDHGDTSCKTPDAAEYILKARAHRKQRGAKTAPKVKARKARG